MVEDQQQGPADAGLLELSRVLLPEHTVDQVLALVVDVAERVLADADAVSITLRGTEGPYTSHTTAAVATSLDEVQYDTDRGPCLQAIRTATSINEPAVDAKRRWPEVVEAATGHGIASFMSLPLIARVDSEPLGAVNIYGRKPEGFPPAAQEVGESLAQQASIVIANAIAFASTATTNMQLGEALVTRDLIGQAKGILMERESCSSEHAFDILRRASQHTNRKLRDVAKDLIDTVEQRGSA